MPVKTLDIGTLEPWESQACDIPPGRGPVEHAFQEMFSIGEILRASDGGAPMGVDPHFDARQTLHVIARMVDNDHPRAVIQLEDQSEAIVLDIVSYKGVKVWHQPTEKGDNDPIIFVRYAYHTKKKTQDLMNVAKALAQSAPAIGTNSIRCASVKEMQILNETFLANSSQIPDELHAKIVAGVDKKLLKIPLSHTSFITPLLIPVQNKAPKGQCVVCGADSAAVCAKCKVTKYCSKVCQKKHWKEGHKSACKTPEEVALEGTSEYANNVQEPEGSAADTDTPWVDIDPKKTPQEMSFYSTFSFAQSLGNSGTPRVQQAKSVFDGIKTDKVMTVKVQIQPGSHADEFAPIMIYPQGKKFQVVGVPQNIIKRHVDYRRLHSLVQSQGYDGGLGVGGCKVYLDAYVKPSGLLRVMLNNVRPMPKW